MHTRLRQQVPQQPIRQRDIFHNQATEIETAKGSLSNMSSSQDNSASYLQQMSTVLGSVASYMRVPVIISSVFFFLVFYSLTCHRTYNGRRASLLFSVPYYISSKSKQIFPRSPRFRKKYQHVTELSYTLPMSQTNPAHRCPDPRNSVSPTSKSL